MTQPQTAKEKVMVFAMNKLVLELPITLGEIEEIIDLSISQTRQDTIKEVEDIIDSYIKGLKDEKSGMSRMIKNDINSQIKIIDCVKYSIKERFGTK